MSSVIIPLHGLSRGCQNFDFQLDGSFLEDFGHEVVEDVDCVAEFAVSRESDWISVECNVRGKVKVICDRCLEDLFLPVAAQEKLTVRFDADWENVVNDDDNVIILPEGEAEVDLGQAVYDFICLSLPLIKAHPEGECNPDAISFIGAGEGGSQAENTPFGALKDMIESKTNNK